MMNTKKQLSYYLISLALAALLSGCGGGEDTPLAFDPFVDQFDANAYNLGFFPLYPYRRDAKLLAAEQINAIGGLLGGKRLNIVATNFQTADAFEVIDLQETARKMIEDYHIPIIGTGSSYVVKKLAEVTVPRKTLLMGDSSTSPSITNLDDNDFVFRIPPSDLFGAQVLAELAWQAGARSCTSLYTETDSYGAGLTQAFADSFSAKGGTVLNNVALPSNLSTGFGQYFPEIYLSQPDCVFPVLLRSTTTANFINEASSIGFNGFYIFSDAALAAGFTDSIANSDSLRGSIAATPGFGLRDSFEYQHFAALYQAQFQQEALNFTAHAYDLIMVLSLAIERAGIINNTDNPTGEMVRDSLRAVMNPPGEPIAPSQIAAGLELIRKGQEVDFYGASNADMGWDANGDVVGAPVYDVYHYSEASGKLEQTQQIVIAADL
ncbi:ABC transporter substrate-binding protein [Candidatus Venteria ishoeyi]|uniref:ABC transporter substrate-binding protein n=1 Tax=Candidatus Venteria ishoeyi TaxID=1899563 RepID=UPI0025A58DE4|nr:ABC transporter substrate-binding protein [Candidatus Venteria ishoeyi]MDM8547947.1 ABC transporter substrate-binding protein [Candidatus Venteria ishoeyi]